MKKPFLLKSGAIPEGSTNITITITTSSKTHTSPVEEQHQDASL